MNPDKLAKFGAIGSQCILWIENNTKPTKRVVIAPGASGGFDVWVEKNGVLQGSVYSGNTLIETLLLASKPNRAKALLDLETAQDVEANLKVNNVAV